MIEQLTAQRILTTLMVDLSRVSFPAFSGALLDTLKNLALHATTNTQRTLYLSEPSGALASLPTLDELSALLQTLLNHLAHGVLESLVVHSTRWGRKVGAQNPSW